MDVTSAEDHEHRGNLEVKEAYVAPDTKSSTVLALVKLERAVINMAEATTVIAIRRARLESALMMTIGTRRERRRTRRSVYVSSSATRPPKKWIW